MTLKLEVEKWCSASKNKDTAVVSLGSALHRLEIRAYSGEKQRVFGVFSVKSCTKMRDFGLRNRGVVFS